MKGVYQVYNLAIEEKNYNVNRNSYVIRRQKMVS